MSVCVDCSGWFRRIVLAYGLACLFSVNNWFVVQVFFVNRCRKCLCFVLFYVSIASVRLKAQTLGYSKVVLLLFIRHLF